MFIDQQQALTGLGLFGLAGGYLGLFLGCALVQLPDFLIFLSTGVVKFFKGLSKYIYAC